MEMIIVTEEEKKTIEAMEAGTIGILGEQYYVWCGELFMDYTTEDGYMEQIDFEVTPNTVSQNVDSGTASLPEEERVPFYLRPVGIEYKGWKPTNIHFKDGQGGPVCTTSYCSSYIDDEKVELAKRIAMALTLVEGIDDEQLSKLINMRKSQQERFEYFFSTKVKGEPLRLRMSSDTRMGSGVLSDGRNFLNLSYSPGAVKQIVDGTEYDVYLVRQEDKQPFLYSPSGVSTTAA